MKLRPDQEIICQWIQPGSRILDLGCGDGTLLRHMMDHHQVEGYGLELDDHNVLSSIENGINVIQSDLDRGLSDYFDSDSFDYVIMSLTLQAMNYPDQLLDEMLRVGKQGIITFPNFGHWRNRLQLLLGGKMPVNRNLPNSWYNTPNIHLCTVDDFETLCAQKGIRILERTVVDRQHREPALLKLAPNLLGEVALYRFERLPYG
ncbi:MAG TPA: methionine biosynthesis protein MetW [Gammaproteobacteria bacterium]|jgi:methionine biosynthesis protein MetW|nr:methionine biosynthesis protein MetW [Gammaproteobacteria bacterium]MBT3488135.1 methionine biosynthesis protein MetW [Gammaproteobacteria bacterium]MBT3719207.1 methionine biosynthesis protein MetW [Gammaproteobacteria bacterium]MBT3844301.1 methionine biosynthesis protein MetW [Gammaproteobacteria bacterium]MBT3894013.1 methionine biosynthesis protein MetW [Gammaproteobacteria bacterium]